MIRNLFFAFSAVLMLAGLWFFFAPHSDEQHAHVLKQLTIQADMPEAIDIAEPQTGISTADYNWQIRDGQITGPQQIEVPEGEIVVFAFLSDRADDIHLHGYEQVISLTPNEPASMTLQLEHSGRFELESHRLHRVLSVLVVEPR